jgi:hypothetical protein
LDKSLLGLFVAVVGSLLLPAMRLARVIASGLTRTGQATADPETMSEIKKQIGHVPLAPSAEAGGFKFRALTAEEKKEFENSSYAKGEPRTSKPRLYLPSPTIVP